MEDIAGRVVNAVEEVLRHATPVMHFRRTATRDTQIRGVPIKEGDKVVMWYCSGDRDEDVFPDPGRFDILRENARSHMAFGAGGAHFCIGAALGGTEDPGRIGLADAVLAMTKVAARSSVTVKASLGLALEGVKIAAGRSTVEPARGDHRFADPSWTENPGYRRLKQAYLAWS